MSTARRLLLLCIALFFVSAAPALAAGTVQVSVSGAGNVTATGINCSRAFGGSLSGDCSETYENVKECIEGPLKPVCLMVPPFVSFTAVNSAPGFAFDGWSGECGGQGATCTIEVAGSYRFGATFKDVQDPVVGLSGVPGQIRGPVTFTATASDNAAVARVDFTLAGAVISDTSAPFSATFDTTGLKDGATQAMAIAYDVNGRSKSTGASTMIDNTAPTAAVGGPNGTVFAAGATPSWTIAPSDAGTGVKNVQCSLVAAGAAADFQKCGSTFTAPVLGNGAWVFTVRVQDAAGNVGDVVRPFSIDAVAPVTTIGAGVADGAVTSDTALTWAFASEPGASFACRVYPAALTPGAFAPCAGAGSHTAAGFGPGVYTFEVQSTDGVGNVETGSAKRTFTVVPAPAPAPALGAPSNPSGLNAAGKSAPQIRVNLTFTFSNSTKKQTKLTTLAVKDVPAGATVSAKGFKKTNASGDVSLKKLLKKPFKAGSTITVTISKPGMGSAIKTLKILPRKTPTVSTKCQAPGAAKPTAC